MAATEPSSPVTGSPRPADAFVSPVTKRAASYKTPSKAPMSHSAAKRRSVLALGSIQHLQHYYAKGAAGARQTAPHPSAQSLSGVTVADHITEEADDETELPPTPSPPERTDAKPYTDIEKEEIPTIHEVWQQLQEVCKSWGLVESAKTLSRTSSPQVPPMMTPSLSADSFASSRSTSPSPPAEGQIADERNLVLSLLTTTTAAIRVVQRYVVALPPGEDDGSDAVVNGLTSLALGDSPLTVRHQSQLAVSTAARPRTSAIAAMPRGSHVMTPKAPRDDPLSALRRASMAVLACLHDMEIRFRTLSDDESRMLTFDRSEMAAQDERDQMGKSPSLETLGDGHLYREGITLDELHRETEIVTLWVETADRVLTETAHLDSRSAASHSKRSFQSAKRNWPTTLRYTENPLGLVYIVLGSFLPPTLLLRLASPSTDRMAFLESLSDGQLLCVAYNSALRASRRPWGFVPTTSIHYDIATSTSDVGRTFRRCENLRVLAAALKLRYALSLADQVGREKAMLTPPGGDGFGVDNEFQPIRQKAQSTPPAEVSAKAFDPRLVARKGEGWDNQLEYLVISWCEAVVAEANDKDDEISSAMP